MLRLFSLALIVVCALLPWRSCAEEYMVLQENKCLETLQFVSLKHLKLLEGLDLDACEKQCLESEEWKERCDTVVYAGQQCFLFQCAGRCTFQKDGCSHAVYMKPGAQVPHPQNENRVEAMMLSPMTGGEEKDKEAEQKSDGEVKKTNNPVCAMPRLVGMCKAAFPRFYFDSETNSCKSFIFGGCGGNGNNFERQEECERTCKGGEKEMTADFQEQCNAPRVVGPCRAAFQRWFYNSTAGQCQRFIYGGCSGNKNNYETEDHCTSNCITKTPPTPKAVTPLPSKKKVPELSEDDRAHCELAPESGPCRAAFTMFYFDIDSQTCKTFLYGGCRGNGNRYTSEAECQERCGNLGAAGRGQGRNRWTAAFFLFLTLAAVSFLLLTTLIVITMRRNRQPPRRALSIRSDKEELLPDSDSLDSLPLPESPNKP